MTGACRSCEFRDLEVILSLGTTPLANRLLTVTQLGEPEPTYPLTLAFCRQCSLVQIIETVPPETLFREYAYFTSFSDTMLRHASALAGPGALSFNNVSCLQDPQEFVRLAS